MSNNMYIGLQRCISLFDTMWHRWLDFAPDTNAKDKLTENQTKAVNGALFVSSEQISIRLANVTHARMHRHDLRILR